MGGLGGSEGSESVQAVTTQHAGKGGLGDRQNHADLGVGTARAPQGEDLGFEFGRSFEGLVQRSRRTVVETLGEVLSLGPGEPAADRPFTDAISGGGGAQREAQFVMSERHLGSRERGESGISVHVVRAGGRWVECSSTTSLANPFRADNLLKHDT